MEQSFSYASNAMNFIKQNKTCMSLNEQNKAEHTLTHTRNSIRFNSL